MCKSMWKNSPHYHRNGHQGSGITTTVPASENVLAELVMCLAIVANAVFMNFVEDLGPLRQVLCDEYEEAQLFRKETVDCRCGKCDNVVPSETLLQHRTLNA